VHQDRQGSPHPAKAVKAVEGAASAPKPH